MSQLLLLTRFRKPPDYMKICLFFVRCALSLFHFLPLASSHPNSTQNIHLPSPHKSSVRFCARATAANSRLEHHETPSPSPSPGPSRPSHDPPNALRFNPHEK